MNVLGLEGTAHTISAGIINERSVLSNISSIYIPKNGGIHPREAAIHHADKIIDVIKSSFDASGILPENIDLVAFSMGPGLGPCLRVVATAARAFSLKYNIPLIGVNHPLGHVEIGRKLSGATDPVMLYISGGNTQVIAHNIDRYHVLGETMDIGLGNMLDKFARDIGIPFPGGPEIEKLAKKGDKLLKLPYSVKGMDSSFSGIYTAAKSYLGKESIENICYSIQETSFAMLVEILERALYYTNKTEILLAGGVARNNRLRDMVSEMALESGYKAYLTDSKYCMDNGAMIAQAGMLMYMNGERQNIMDTKINQRFRIDEVIVPWIKSESSNINNNKGAESIIEMDNFYGRSVINKTRIVKKYRNHELDSRIRRERMRNEFNMLYSMHDAEINVPIVYDLDVAANTIKLEYIPGITLNNYLNSKKDHSYIIDKLALQVSKMHNNKISHGDLTPNNIIILNDDIYLIDPSMGHVNAKDEDIADDLFLLTESFKGLYGDYLQITSLFIERYKIYKENSDKIIDILKEIRARRRYV